jgi:hypothetical protein
LDLLHGTRADFNAINNTGMTSLMHLVQRVKHETNSSKKSAKIFRNVRYSALCKCITTIPAASEWPSLAVVSLALLLLWCYRNKASGLSYMSRRIELEGSGEQLTLVRSCRMHTFSMAAKQRCPQAHGGAQAKGFAHSQLQELHILLRQ